jgi:DNA-binding GntR family transcriptional regulator
MLKHRRQFEAEHRALLAAIGDGDADRAAALLEAHLAGASEHLVAELERGHEPLAIG